MSFGRSAPEPGAGAYAVWVGTLRSWARDPSTSLASLPQLTEDSFDQETYGRLLAHVNTAIGSFMEAWHTELTQAFARARTTHELATELLRLRRLLEPRVLLAQSPAWPPQVRDALWKALLADVDRIQADLESALAETHARGRYDRAESDTLVDVARKNPLTAIGSDAAAAPAVAQPIPASTPVPLGVARPARRILADPSVTAPGGLGA